MAAFAAGRLRLRMHLCAVPGCRRFTVAHRLLRKDGVFLDGAWLCSAGCLEAQIAGSLAAEEARRVYTMPRLPRMPFRLLLLERGVVSEAGLAQALSHAECTGLSLARALVALELVTEAELAASLAAENGCAFYALPPTPVAPEAELPGTLAERYEAAAVHVAPGRVLLGFVHRIDRELVRCFERMTGQKAESCFITGSHFQRQMTLVRSHDRKQKSSIERAASPGEAARAVVRHALRFGAEQLLARRLGSVVWVRMFADGRVEDRFFQIEEEPSRSASVKVPHVVLEKLKKLQVL